MFSTGLKREIADKIQKILQETNHSQLPKGEISFMLHVNGAETWCWANIVNNRESDKQALILQQAFACIKET